MKQILTFMLITFCLSLFADWTIVETYEIPEGASGLAYDGNYLYCGIYGANGDELYQIDPADGSYELAGSGFLEDCFGLTYDGQYFWTIERLGAYEPSNAIQFDLMGNIQNTIELPTTYMSGVAYEEDNLWIAAYYDPDGQIYKIDMEGNILTEFPAPDNQPWDLCLENENLWMADYWGDAIYKIDPADGTMLESYNSEGTDPAGIVFDGQYLWYCDNGSGGYDYLYKIDLGGSGTPAIEVDIEEYNFGNTIIGEFDTYDLTIHNTGSAELIIDWYEFSLDEFYSSIELPISIAAGENFDLPLYFEPNTHGNFNGILTLDSNDPINPETIVNLSGFGIYENQEIETDLEQLAFGDVRVNAFTGRFINIANMGNQDLIITDMETGTENFSIDDGNFDLPITLSTRDSLLTRIWFNPEEDINYTDILTIYSNDNDEPEYEVNLEGQGTIYSTDMGTALWHFSTNDDFEKVVAMKKFVDLTGDDYAEVLIADNDYNLYCLNGNSSGEADVLWQFSSEIPSIGYGSIYDNRGLTYCDDLNDDGVEDVVIGTAWGSRSIFALDGSNGEIIWYYDTDEYGEGGWVYQVNADKDYNMDNIPDVLAVCGDDSNDMGPKAVYLLDGPTGDKIWDKRFNQAQASVITYPTVDWDGTPEVIAGSSSDYNDAKVHMISSNGDVAHEIEVSSIAVWALMLLPDINNDGWNEFVYGTFNGLIQCLNADFDTAWTTNTSGIITRFEKFTSNNNTFIIPVVSGTGSCKIIDTQDGSTHSDYSSAGNFLTLSSAGDLNGDNFNDILGGKLNNSFEIFSGNDGEQIYQLNVGEPVDQVLAIDDMDDTNTSEIIYGLRNGYVKCMAAGDNGSDSQENVVEYNKIYLSNFPNPFNPTTTIDFSIPNDSKVNLSIYNLKGQKVKTLANEQLERGNHSVVWQGKDKYGKAVSSGVYFYKLKVNGKNELVKKCLLLK